MLQMYSLSAVSIQANTQSTMNFKITLVALFAILAVINASPYADHEARQDDGDEVDDDATTSTKEPVKEPRQGNEEKSGAKSDEGSDESGDDASTSTDDSVQGGQRGGDEQKSGPKYSHK